MIKIFANPTGPGAHLAPDLFYCVGFWYAPNRRSIIELVPESEKERAEELLEAYNTHDVKYVIRFVVPEIDKSSHDFSFQ